MAGKVAAIFALLNTEMKSQGKTQSELSALTGIHLSKISVWFRGKGNPPIDEVVRVAQALGKSLGLVDDEK